MKKGRSFSASSFSNIFLETTAVVIAAAEEKQDNDPPDIVATSAAIIASVPHATVATTAG